MADHPAKVMDAIEDSNNSNGIAGNPRSEHSVNLGGGGDQYPPLPPEILDFAERMGMHVCQVNAQRYLGPSINMQPGWTPEQGTEVFIGRLPRYMDERELYPFLEQAGPIYQLRLLMDFSGTNKGYGFVQYFTRYHADNAIAMLHGAEIRNKICMVACRSVDNRRLVLGGVPTNKTEEEIYKQVKVISDGVVSVHLNWSGHEYQPKGLVIVVFESHRAAALTRKVFLNKRQPVMFWGNPITVDWAEPEISTGNENKQQVLRVRNLTAKTTTAGLHQMFTQESFYGVKKLQRINDKAYVYFWTRDQAEAAKLAMNGLQLAGKRILVDWMNPKFIPRTAREKEEMARRSQQQQQNCKKPQQRQQNQKNRATVLTTDTSNITSIPSRAVN